MDFLVLFQFGPAPTDLKICDVIRDKKAEEADTAIEEAMTEGAGEYIAVPLSKAIRRRAEQKFDLMPTNGDPLPAEEAPVEPPG